MRKGKHVIGQAVLSFADGSRVDTVKDLLISETNDAIVALLVDEGGLLSSSRVVPIENVNRFGRDAVVINATDSVVRASADPEVKAILQRKETLLGKRVVTDAGQALGSVSDMYFDETSGRIQGFEVSGGMLGDMARGPSYLAVDEIERLGPDVIFVRPETAEALEGQVGGVQGALKNAGDKLGDAASQASTGLQSGIAQREPEKALIGRRSGRDVTDENGRIIVANGERIRAEHIDWARETDNISLLTSAATAGETRDMGARAGSAMEQAGDGIGSMWDRFQAKVSEMRDEQGRQADAQQTAQRLALIQDAIGRPVAKVILDRQDNVILDFGDIVTHQSVQQAFDNGMLDTLLSSVHRATVSFPLNELKAQQPASATVEKSSGGAALVDDLERKIQETERERAEAQERQRAEAERQRQEREGEREERARQREETERQRQQEIEEAKNGSAGGNGSPIQQDDSTTPTTEHPIRTR